MSNNSYKNIESWHKVYPNNKRNCKVTERNNKYLLYQLLDKLIYLGYEKKVYLISSIFRELVIKQHSNYKENEKEINISFLKEKNKYIIEYPENCSFEYDFDAAISKICKILSDWEIADNNSL